MVDFIILSVCLSACQSPTGHELKPIFTKLHQVVELCPGHNGSYENLSWSTHKIFVVARSCTTPEIYFEWSQGLRHIKDGLAMGTRHKKKDMSWLCRGCVASQSCDSRGTIVSCWALSGGCFSGDQVVGHSWDARASVSRLYNARLS